jgi:5'(3')-deoxyribonucleotidase
MFYSKNKLIHPDSFNDREKFLILMILIFQVVQLCGQRAMTDLMIDDHKKILDHFPGETIMFTQPHNMLIGAGRHRQVSSRDEIE